MKNKKTKILEFSFRWSLSVKFISETIRDRAKFIDYNLNILVQSSQRKNFIKLDEKLKKFKPLLDPFSK